MGNRFLSLTPMGENPPPAPPKRGGCIKTKRTAAHLVSICSVGFDTALHFVPSLLTGCDLNAWCELTASHQHGSTKLTPNVRVQFTSLFEFCFKSAGLISCTPAINFFNRYFFIQKTTQNTGNKSFIKGTLCFSCVR